MQCHVCGWFICADMTCFECSDHFRYCSLNNSMVNSTTSTSSFPMTATEINKKYPSNYSIAKRCSSCEEPVGVTDHICKALDKSIDWLDLMARLK